MTSASAVLAALLILSTQGLSVAGDAEREYVLGIEGMT
jgi:hypothetical protein